MRLNSKKILITFLLVVELIMGSLTYQSFLHKEINKEENKVEKKQFAMFIKEDNEYVEYKGDSLFPEGYYVNNNLSKCVDENDNLIENAINSMGNRITITSSKTVYCTLYFDKNINLEYLRSKDTINALSKNIVGDMYRYQGIYTDDIRNYICLGDNCCKTEECNADTNDDMYRIIGINENGELKVIKKTALTESVKWWSDLQIDINWPQSLIYQKLNGKSENSTEPNLNDTNSYYYSLNENLKSIIVNNHSWLYGDSYTFSEVYNGDKVYEIESGNNEAVYNKKTEEESEIVREKWSDRIEAPLGLMYISDYMYAYKTNEEDAGNPENKEYAINGWIHLNNNEITHPSLTANKIYEGYEFTIGRFGFRPTRNNYGAWRIAADGSSGHYNLDVQSAIRPVFYLSNKIELNGEGTLSEPFEIDYAKIEANKN